LPAVGCRRRPSGHRGVAARGQAPLEDVLGVALLRDGAQIGPLTLVMKGEQLPPRSSWVGSPAQPMKKVRAETAQAAKPAVTA